MDIHTLYSDRTLHSGDGRPPHILIFTVLFFKDIKMICFGLLHILCSHFHCVPGYQMYVQLYTVIYMYIYIVLTCLLKLAPCLVINLAPSDEGTPAM